MLGFCHRALDGSPRLSDKFALRRPPDICPEQPRREMSYPRRRGEKPGARRARLRLRHGIRRMVRERRSPFRRGAVREARPRAATQRTVSPCGRRVRLSRPGADPALRAPQGDRGRRPCGRCAAGHPRNRHRAVAVGHRPLRDPAESGHGACRRPGRTSGVRRVTDLLRCGRRYHRVGVRRPRALPPTAIPGVDLVDERLVGRMGIHAYRPAPHRARRAQNRVYRLRDRRRAAAHLRRPRRTTCAGDHRPGRRTRGVRADATSSGRRHRGDGDAAGPPRDGHRTPLGGRRRLRPRNDRRDPHRVPR